MKAEEEIWLLPGRPGRGAGRRVSDEGARGGAQAAMGRFWGREPTGAVEFCWHAHFCGWEVERI
jgi:hypothetical protein